MLHNCKIVVKVPVSWTNKRNHNLQSTEKWFPFLRHFALIFSYWNHLNRLSLHPHPHQHRSVTGTHHKLRAGTGTTMHGIATVPKAGTRSHLMPPTIPTTTMRVASITRGSEGEGCNSRPARRGGMMTGTMKMRTTPPTVPPTPAR